MAILIVDDSELSRQLLKMHLEKGGYTDLVLVSSARGAYEALGMGGPNYCEDVDLVLMDNSMPEISGIAATERIKTVDRLKDIPIVMVTGSSEDHILQAAFDAGAIDYIKKPYSKIELLARVRSALTLKEETQRRKSREKSLARSRASLTKAQEIAQIGNWDWNFEQNTMYWSSQQYRILGYAPKEFVANYQSLIGGVHIDDAEYVKKTFFRAIFEEKPLVSDFRVSLADGTEKVVSLQGEVVFDDDGEPVGALGTLQDITERKKTEEALRKAKSEAEEARKILEEEHHEAEQIGKSLLKAIPEDKRLTTCVRMEQSSTAGGDRAGFIHELTGREWLMVTDASGHGKGAAKFQEVALGSLLALLFKGRSMKEALIITNRLLERIGAGRFLVGNVWRVMREGEKGAIEGWLWVEEYNIGQHFVVEIDRETGDVTEWKWPANEPGKAMMLGMFEDGFDDMASIIRKVKKNSRIFSFTDGLTEACNPDGEQFSMKRLVDLFVNTRSLSADLAHSGIVAGVKRWTGGLPGDACDEEINNVQIEDDITLAVVDI